MPWTQLSLISKHVVNALRWIDTDILRVAGRRDLAKVGLAPTGDRECSRWMQVKMP